jgi:hypothetical protein
MVVVFGIVDSPGLRIALDLRVERFLTTMSLEAGSVGQMI